jgi:hypothetical protein
MGILINHGLGLEKGNPAGKQGHKATGLVKIAGLPGSGKENRCWRDGCLLLQFWNALRVIEGRFVLRRGGDAGGEGSVA